MSEGDQPGQPLDKHDQAEENAGVAVAGRQRETHMGFARTLATIAFIIALPVALITTNVRLLANAPLVYRYAFDRYDAQSSTGLSRADLNSTAAALRDVLQRQREDLLSHGNRRWSTDSVFNARETRHMEDVKRLFVIADDAQEVSAVYVLLYVVGMFVWARGGSMRQLAAQSLIGIALGAAFVGGIGIFAAFGFEAAFTRFHELVFSNNFWQLNPATDHLIQMFPPPFWRDMTIFLGLMCAAEAVLIGGVSAVSCSAPAASAGASPPASPSTTRRRRPHSAAAARNCHSERVKKLSGRPSPRIVRAGAVRRANPLPAYGNVRERHRFARHRVRCLCQLVVQPAVRFVEPGERRFERRQLAACGFPVSSSRMVVSSLESAARRSIVPNSFIGMGMTRVYVSATGE